LDIGSYKFVANQILAQSGGESGNYINIFVARIFKDWIVSCNNAYACEFWYFIKMSALVGNLDI
jgi:hypothetical protein